MSPTIFHKFLAELLGTYLLVLFGCGAVHASVLAAAPLGSWQIGIVWGVAMMAVAVVGGGISGAHLNPAVTLSMALWGRCRGSHIVPYFFAQFLGAFFAAATLHTLYGGMLLKKDAELNTLRGQPGSIVTASCYGEYFPSPSTWTPGGTVDVLAATGQPMRIEVVTQPVAFLAELIGTAILVLVVFAISDRKNQHAPPSWLGAAYVGLTLAALITFLSPLTQAGFNPARDFAPRLFAYFAGWREVAMPGPNGVGYITVYVMAPFLGAIVGGGCYEAIFRPLLSVKPIDLDATARYLNDEDE